MITDTRIWLEEIGKTIDSKDGVAFAAFLTEDGNFRFGNQPAVTGRKAIADYVNAFFTMHNGSSHEVVNYWKSDAGIVWQGKVTYTRMDNRKVDVNFTNIFYMKGDLISDYLIYIDNSPLFAE
jgi:hypothetical protein